MSRRLEGKVALITGAASGIGRATAQEFIQQGAKVIICDINNQLGTQLAQNLGPDAHFVHCDVTSESQVAQAVDVAVARYGKLDILYNNAGIPGPSFPPSIADLDLDGFDNVMKINVRGTMAGIKHAARVMIPAGSGSILCTASISGVLGGNAPHPYTISKFTIPGIVKSVAHELCKHGIRINCISPGPTPTPMVVRELAGIYRGADAVINTADANLLRRGEEHFVAKKECISSVLGLALDCCAEVPLSLLGIDTSPRLIFSAHTRF